MIEGYTGVTLPNIRQEDRELASHSQNQLSQTKIQDTLYLEFVSLSCNDLAGDLLYIGGVTT
jgi:hypothetical protein